MPEHNVIYRDGFVAGIGWVILCSGFREAVVRRHFDFISLCFCDWESADTICKYAEYFKAAALTRFANKLKIQAIIMSAEHIRNVGFEHFRSRILLAPSTLCGTYPLSAKSRLSIWRKTFDSRRQNRIVICSDLRQRWVTATQQASVANWPNVQATLYS